ncbi:MAG: DUF3105 domain-containing protein [Candidatus Eremiobacteraeota bacterium]|nr:DUF3105 domain-containing protein [Candidatus Eremiobacteraeota bacterium]
MPKSNKKGQGPQQKSPGPRSVVQWWPAVVAAVVVVAAGWLLYAHLRAANAEPQPAPSVISSDHYPAQGHQGHSPGDAKRHAHFRYSSDPPTSGFHLEIFSPGFVNAQPLPKYVQVHLLEHGNILLQYNCLCPATANALAEIATEFDNRLVPAGAAPTTRQIQNAEERGLAVVVAPYPNMKHTIALTAWTRLASMNSVNKTDIISFINRWLRDPDNLSQ